MVLPYINMNPPRVYTCSPSWTPLPVPSLWVIPVHQPQASCIVHWTWTGDSFLIWYYTCFNAILPIVKNHKGKKSSLIIMCFPVQTISNTLMFKLVLEKAEEPEIKLPTSTGSSKKQESSRKTSISALLTMPRPLTVWITINCGKFWKRWEYQTIWSASWETYMQVRKQQLELDMEQQTGSK